MQADADAVVLPLGRRPLRMIVLEPAGGSRWCWQMYYSNGRLAGTRSEVGTFSDAMASLRHYSETTGLPAYQRGNLHSAPEPLTRGARGSRQ